MPHGAMRARAGLKPAPAPLSSRCADSGGNRVALTRWGLRVTCGASVPLAHARAIPLKDVHRSEERP